MSTSFRKLLWAAAALSIFPASAALGSVITFGNLTGNNGDTFSSYVEAGYTVTSTVGQWCDAFSFGNPVPDLYAGDVCGGTAPDTIAVTDGGGSFAFISFDMASNNGTTAYTIVGKNGINTVFTQNGSSGATANFITVASSHINLITELDITFQPVAGAPEPTSYNIDNIHVNALSVSSVPEPSFFPILLGLAVAGVFELTRRANEKR